MTQEQALNVLVQAVQVAQAKGAYSLDEASVVASAVKVFVKQEAPEVETAEEAVEEQLEVVKTKKSK